MGTIAVTDLGPVGYEQHGGGHDVVMLHSLLTDRRVYDRVLPLLAADYRVTLPDLPGYGQSAPVRADVAAYADVVVALADEIGVDPAAALIGNGLGAFVAMAAAARHPDRFGRLVLVGVALRFPDDAKEPFDRMAERALAGGMAAVVEGAVGRIFTAPYMVEHPEMVQERAETLHRIAPDGFAAGCRTIRDLDLTDDAATIASPVLVVVGSEDVATPPEYGRSVADTIGGAIYHELPGVAHAPQLQDPEGFVAAIAPFLAAAP